MSEITLSVVIASLNGRPYIDSCLEALTRQDQSIRAEIIIADCIGATVTEFIKANYPDVQVIAFNERKSVPALRAAGMLVAKGDIIVITEDHCIPADNWFETLVAAHRTYPELAIGGAVDNAATERLIDWAVYFCEYSNFTSPLPAGIVHDLPGPNVSYKRKALDLIRDMLRDGYWENFIHQHLEANGYPLRAEPSIIVWHKKHFTLASFVSERFHYGRWFAGTRNKFVSPAKRLFYLVFSLLLPPLILYRLYKRVQSRGSHMPMFWRSLPLIAFFTLVWALGEFVGYATGEGKSVLQLS